MVVSFHICLAPTNRLLLSFTLLSPFKTFWLCSSFPLWNRHKVGTEAQNLINCNLRMMVNFQICLYCQKRKLQALLLVLKVERHPHQASKFPCLREQSILKILWFVNVSGWKLSVCLMYTNKTLMCLCFLLHYSSRLKRSSCNFKCKQILQCIVMSCNACNFLC